MLLVLIVLTVIVPQGVHQKGKRLNYTEMLGDFMRKTEFVKTVNDDLDEEVFVVMYCEEKSSGFG